LRLNFDRVNAQRASSPRKSVVVRLCKANGGVFFESHSIALVPVYVDTWPIAFHMLALTIPPVLPDGLL
jgi:hypothetical protein